jgi:hypothetical protein
MTLTIRAQQIVNAGRRINEGGVSLGRLVREGKQMGDLARYEYAAVIREVADRLCTDWGELQHPYDVLNDIANELEE